MDELDPLIIGTHSEAMQAAHRIMIGMHRRIMDHYLDQAQRDMDRYNAGRRSDMVHPRHE